MLRTPVDILIPDRTIDEVRDLARTRHGRWWRKGLILRVKGDRVRARIQELSRSSQAPTLLGRIVPAPNGTRVVGNIRWTIQLAWLAVWGLGLPTLLGVGLAFLHNGDVPGGLFLVAFSPFFGWMAVSSALHLRVEREYETTRLTNEIRHTFAQGR
jgi:hypothetical protein